MATHIAMPNMPPEANFYGNNDNTTFDYEANNNNNNLMAEVARTYKLDIANNNNSSCYENAAMPTMDESSQENAAAAAVGTTMPATEGMERMPAAAAASPKPAEEKVSVFNPAAAVFKPSSTAFLKFDVIIPNRIFVGGISSDTTEADLRLVFSAYGHVKDTKIIIDHCGVNKGYGFVTFATPEEAQRLQTEGLCVFLRDRKLSIGPAIRKQLVPKVPSVLGDNASYERLMNSICVKHSSATSYGTATVAGRGRTTYDILSYYPKWSVNGN